LLSMTLSPCCPYQPRRSVSPHQSLRRSMLPSPENGGLGLRVLSFRGHMGLLHYGPATRSPSFSDGFVNRLQDSQFPSFLLFKLRGLDSYPGGTCTHCSCQPSLDAPFPLTNPTLKSSISGLAFYHEMTAESNSSNTSTARQIAKFRVAGFRLLGLGQTSNFSTMHCESRQLVAERSMRDCSCLR